jgi:hypothetical protein
MYKVRFKNWNCRLVFGRYPNGRIAIQLYNDEPLKEDGYTVPPGKELIATATVNVVDYEVLGKNQVIIKNYSENEGMLPALINAKIISTPVDMARTGFVTVAICDLLVEPVFGCK